jgi:hypothetical protein
MSFADGWAAMHLETPPRVPRTEFSADFHWDLVSAVTGLSVGYTSTDEERTAASRAFVKAWDYDMIWATDIAGGIFGDKVTDMGHAEYMQGGVDFNDNTRHPFTEPEQVLNFDPWETFGERDHGDMVRFFEQCYQDRCQAFPDTVNMTGIYVSGVSAFIAIFGWDLLLLAAGIDIEGFGDAMSRYGQWIRQYYLALAEADVPVVMLHDDMVWTSGAIFHPDWYRRYLFPVFRRNFEPVIESGKRVLFTSDGTYTEFIDDIADCGVHGFVLEPTVDMRYIAEKYGKTHVFIGNADTRILLSGTREDIWREVQRCMDIGKGCPGFFMAVGNHIPPNTPVDNAMYYDEVYEELAVR